MADGRTKPDREAKIVRIVAVEFVDDAIGAKCKDASRVPAECRPSVWITGQTGIDVEDIGRVGKAASDLRNRLQDAIDPDGGGHVHSVAQIAADHAAIVRNRGRETRRMAAHWQDKRGAISPDGRTVWQLAAAAAAAAGADDGLAVGGNAKQRDLSAGGRFVMFDF